MKNVLIVGVGNIGSRWYKEYAGLSPDRYDPYKGYDEKRDIRYDFAFIATDTPMREDGSCDLSQVSQAVEETDAEVYARAHSVEVLVNGQSAGKKKVKKARANDMLPL